MTQVQKLLRRELRQNAKKEPIILIETKFTRLAKLLCEEIFTHGPPITITQKPTGKPNEFTPTSQEEYLANQLQSFLENNDVQTTSPLMHTIPEKLLITVAQKHNISFKPTNTAALDLIEKIQTLQPQTKASLQKSFDSIRKTCEKSIATHKKL